MIITHLQLAQTLVEWAESLTSEERQQARTALTNWCEEHAEPLETTRKMKNDLDTLTLNDFDRDFLRSLKIAIPDDARWEIDSDATGASDSESAE